MHNLSASFILGYHGCHSLTGEKLLSNEAFEPNANDYDWLGPGIYCWKANPDRALEWARNHVARLKKRDGIDRKPFVVGAIVDLGFCLVLISSNGVKAVEKAYALLESVVSSTKTPTPTNQGGRDLHLRRLDCAVIQVLHQARRLESEPAFDTVRGVFTEGEHIYAGSGFRRKTHIQVCVTNPDAIKVYFGLQDGTSRKSSR